jgi:hypothetical protein
MHQSTIQVGDTVDTEPHTLARMTVRLSTSELASQWNALEPDLF